MANSFGAFLKEMRQKKNLTQKELAALLYITESAVSKWEKDVAHPDITLLPRLAEILGVTEHEIITASIDNTARKEREQAKKWRTLSFTWSLFFYIAYAVALIPCFICNLAINKTLSWFFIVFCALLLAFTFTNLPKLIKKHRLILLPLCSYVALCLLLGTCCIYTQGRWFLIPAVAVLLGLVIIFVPIYIAKYDVFAKIKKYNGFASICIDFIMTNILLGVINAYTSANYGTGAWYFTIALPILLYLYVVLNVLLGIGLLKLSRLIKTGIILFLCALGLYLPPMLLRLKNPQIQASIDQANILKANLQCWQGDCTGTNVHLIIFLSLMLLSLMFIAFGVTCTLAKKRK